MYDKPAQLESAYSSLMLLYITSFFYKAMAAD